MKRIINDKLFTVIGLMLFFSCSETRNDGTPVEIPSWLKDKITQDKIDIVRNKQPILQVGKWMQTEYKGDYYYEYNNKLLPTYYPPISYNGDTLDISKSEIHNDYLINKCCEIIVWNGHNIKAYEIN